MDTLDDLLIAIGSEAYGRFVMAGRNGSQTAAWKAQESLTAIVQAAQKSGKKNYTRQVRARLTKEINELSQQAIVGALEALEKLEKLECRLEAGTTRGKVTYVRAAEFLPVMVMREILLVSSKMRTHPESLSQSIEDFARQDVLSRLWDLEIERSSDEQDQLAVTHSRMLRRDVNLSKDEIVKKKGEAVRLIPTVLEGSENPLPPLTLFLRAIEKDADNQLLAKMGKRYESLGRALKMPLPLAPNATVAQTRQWKAAWRTYEEYGEALALLGAWIRNLGMADPARRCDLCYRYVAEHKDRRCSEHKLASGKKVPAIEYHTARLYQEELKRLRNIDVTDVSFADVFLVEDFEKDLSPRLLRLGFPKELVRQAVVLKTMLHRLAHLQGPELTHLVDQHFMDMLAYADMHPECFENEAPFHSPYDEIDEKVDLRKMDIRTFLWTWYGEEPWRLGADDKMDGKGLDPSHPFLKDLGVVYSRIKIDFLHLRAWLEAKMRVRDMYIDPERVKAMREETDSRDRRRTYASIASELGISIEAVRKILLRANQTLIGAAKRRRISGK